MSTFKLKLNYSEICGDRMFIAYETILRSSQRFWKILSIGT